VVWQFLRGKSTVSQTGDLLDILRDILLTVNFDNRERFRQMVLEEKAGAEAYITQAGHAIANSRVRSYATETDWAAEQIGGVTYLFFLRKLAEQVEKDWPSVLNALQTMHRILLNRNAMLFNVSLDAGSWANFRPQLAGLIDALPAAPAATSAWAWQNEPKSEGLAVPSQVNYVVQGANLYELGYQLDGSSRVILQFMSTTYMWEKIRVQGGAYGGFAAFDAFSGNFSFMSYRDPNLVGTLNNYAGAGEFLQNLDLNQEELTRSIIGAIGGMDAHLLPDAKGYTSMMYYLLRYTDEERQRIRDQVLSASADDFKAFGEVLSKVADSGVVVVVGSKDNINTANAERGDFLAVTNVL
jgi:Zn-dependent M16 (insulinase) family peptidase